MISLPESTVSQDPMIAFKPCLEQKSFPSGVLDVGYVYDLKN